MANITFEKVSFEYSKLIPVIILESIIAFSSTILFAIIFNKQYKIEIYIVAFIGILSLLCYIKIYSLRNEHRNQIFIGPTGIKFGSFEFFSWKGLENIKSEKYFNIEFFKVESKVSKDFFYIEFNRHSKKSLAALLIKYSPDGHILKKSALLQNRSLE